MQGKVEKKVKPLSLASREEFDLIIKNVIKKLNVNSPSEMADKLGISQAAISDAKSRKAIPGTWIKKFEKHGVYQKDLVPIQYKTADTGRAAENSEPEKEKKFRSMAHNSFEIIIDWIAEEYGQDATAIEDFRDDFKEKFSEFSLWRQKKRRGNNPESGTGTEG